MKIRFLVNYTTKEAAPRTFQKDSVHDVPDLSAQHFLNRGVAVLAVEEPKPESAAIEDKKQSVRAKANAKG
jgi:hypothetical protein